MTCISHYVYMYVLQEDNICELEMKLQAKQAEQDSVQERLTNADLMVRLTKLLYVLLTDLINFALSNFIASTQSCVLSWLLLCSMKTMTRWIRTSSFHR